MSVKAASPRMPDLDKHAGLAALPFRVLHGSVPLLLEYEDSTTVPVRYTPSPEYRTLVQKYSIRADERPGRQVVDLLNLYREQEAAFAQCLSENEKLTRQVRELEGELASEKARSRSLKERKG